jgi:transglutaminase-like putative cysteine protease
VLTAAMCRAVGIPAEVVMGVMYVEEFAGIANIFGGHAWTQVYLGDKWIGLDATRAPNGYDARHITLASGNGNLESFLELLSTIGNFKITDVKIQRDKS